MKIIDLWIRCNFKYCAWYTPLPLVTIIIELSLNAFWIQNCFIFMGFLSTYFSHLELKHSIPLILVLINILHCQSMGISYYWQYYPKSMLLICISNQFLLVLWTSKVDDNRYKINVINIISYAQVCNGTMN